VRWWQTAGEGNEGVPELPGAMTKLEDTAKDARRTTAMPRFQSDAFQ